MKQILYRYGLLLLTVALGMVLLSGCRQSPGTGEPNGQKETVAEPSANTAPLQTEPARETVLFEEPDLPRPEEVPDESISRDVSLAAPCADTRPMVAIIIDDMGYHDRIGDKLLELDLALSFSFLPHAPFAAVQEEKAYQMGRDIMAHLPMEASDPKWDPGPGALLLAASKEELLQTLQRDLVAIPHATGANNHMGSKFTQNRPAMQIVLQELKRQDLFFIDSYTTSRSTGLNEARALGIRTGRRHIFLDNVQDADKICIQLDKLSELAEKQEQAIGIAHPYQATLDAFRACRRKLLSRVQLVPVHELVE